MIYATGSKLFKAVVVVAATANAHASCCGGEDAATDAMQAEGHVHSGQSIVHDMADAGEEADKEHDSDFPSDNEDGAGDGDADVDTKADAGGMGGMGDMFGDLGKMFGGMDMENMDFEAMMKQMGGMEGMQEMLKGMGGMEGLEGMGDMPEPEKAEEITEEQFLEAKEKLELSDEDVQTITEYVAKVPAHFKDESMSDEKLAQMFVYHYLTGEDEEADMNEDGTPKEKNRQNLLDEVKHLVEVEIPGIEAEEAAAAEARKAEADSEKGEEEAAAMEPAEDADAGLEDSEGEQEL